MSIILNGATGPFIGTDWLGASGSGNPAPPPPTESASFSVFTTYVFMDWGQPAPVPVPPFDPATALARFGYWGTPRPDLG